MYRKYNLLTGLTCKLLYVPLVSKITPVKLSHIVFPVYLEIWKMSDSFKNKIKLRTLDSRNLLVPSVLLSTARSTSRHKLANIAKLSTREIKCH